MITKIVGIHELEHFTSGTRSGLETSNRHGQSARATQLATAALGSYAMNDDDDGKSHHIPVLGRLAF